MYNEDLNNVNTEENISDVQTNVMPIENNSYQDDYPVYSGTDITDEEDSNKKGPFFIIIIFVILILLGLLGFFGYRYFFGDDKDIKIDNITVEGGNLSPEFSSNISNYNVESINDSIKLVCTYKDKIVNAEGCNKSILLTDNKSTTITVKLEEKNYTFNVIGLNSESPIINNVSGNNLNDWTKSVVLTVDAIFNNEQHNEAYSFDGGKTWQKENYKEINVSGDISIVVRDIKENMSSIYVEKIEKIDATAPEVKISISNKLATITATDNDSGITNIMVTKSSVEPDKITEIDLTKETILRYTAISEGDFYAWVKDKAGNVGMKKFTIKKAIPGGGDQPTTPAPTPTPVEEKITLKVSGNKSSWTNKITLKATATSNKKGNLVYSFDGGSTFSTTNEKTFVANQTVKIVVKNQSTGKTVSAEEKIKTIDNNKPSCSNISGASTEWTNLDRTITVTCSDSESGCKESKITNTFNRTTKTYDVTIYDNVGNKTICPVNVYVDKTGPTLTYKTEKNSLGKIYKFQLFVTDNETGINMDSVKYKQKILKTAPDNVWHKKFDNSKELSAIDGIYYSYRFTKETTIYKYFTISVSDNVGNISEMLITIEN